MPPAFERLAAEAPAALTGMARLAWYANNLRMLTPSDRADGRKLFERLARAMRRAGASDLDVGGMGTRGAVWFRTGTRKAPVDALGTFDLNATDVWILSLLSGSQRSALLRARSVDFSRNLGRRNQGRPARRGSPERRVRVTVYVEDGHLALSMRRLAEAPRSLASLGFAPPVARSFLFRHQRSGLTLLAGASGSGKSATLDAIVHANNQDTSAHVLVVAEPLEYIHPSEKCMIRHREVGRDVPTFAAGMTQGLRQDPDIVVVGEMRDAETMATAMKLADTGHRVFSTVHAGGVVEALTRVVASHPPAEQRRVRHRLSDVLRTVVCQKLLPAARGTRVMAKEVLRPTTAARDAVQEGRTDDLYQMMWEGSSRGMTTLEQDIARLVRRGDVDRTTALRYANNERRLRQLLGR
jgi:twitching motility protein PilT